MPPPLFRGRARMPEVERPEFKQGCLQVVAQSRCKDAPTTNDHDCRDAKQTERSSKGKGGGASIYKQMSFIRLYKRLAGAHLVLF